MRTDMEQWTEIRRKVLVEGVSKRQVVEDYRLGWATLKKILTNSEPPGYQGRDQRPKRKLTEGLLEEVDKILEADKEAPAKQRHTARRIFERLRDEHGYTGGITQVREAVARARMHTKEALRDQPWVTGPDSCSWSIVPLNS